MDQVQEGQEIVNSERNKMCSNKSTNQMQQFIKFIS